MTEHERGVYLLLCMSGRESEALEYRDKCEERHAEERRKEQEDCNDRD